MYDTSLQDIVYCDTVYNGYVLRTDWFQQVCFCMLLWAYQGMLLPLVYAHNYYDLPFRKIEPHSGNSSVSEPHTHEPQAYRYYSKAHAITSLQHAVTRFIVSPDLNYC